MEFGLEALSLLMKLLLTSAVVRWLLPRQLGLVLFLLVFVSLKTSHFGSQLFDLGHKLARISRAHAFDVDEHIRETDKTVDVELILVNL